MRRLADETPGSELSYYFASHPHPGLRLARLEQRIEEAQ
ncbi:MAG: hypothetical protein BWY87_00374 [Deltaproteobacteria bacterium ADurb.Bin510]|nr:MAG: hypothetical protein BWY87_00374 [Deltaproteobacteria bacterium ADurb.Bin510]